MYFLNFSLEWLTNYSDNIVDTSAELVENPVFSLEEGSYGSDQTLKLTCATEGAKIYYTLDGSTPNVNATLYQNPISLTRTATVKAIAVKANMVNSYIISKNYIIGWPIPTQKRHVGDDRYLTNISTENATQNIEYKANKAPNSHYIFIENQIKTKAKESFILKTSALKNQTDGMQFCQAIILVDWNKDYDFDDDNELIAIIGNREDNNEKKVMDITQNITVPDNAVIGKTRMRIVYTDSWRDDFDHLGLDPVDKGRCYDVDVIVNIADGINNISSSNWIIFPNPVKDKLTIKGNEKQPVKITLISLDGKVVYSKKFNDNIYNLNLQNLKSGYYIVKISNKSKVLYSSNIMKM